VPPNVLLQTVSGPLASPRPPPRRRSFGPDPRAHYSAALLPDGRSRSRPGSWLALTSPFPWVHAALLGGRAKPHCGRASRGPASVHITGRTLNLRIPFLPIPGFLSPCPRPVSKPIDRQATRTRAGARRRTRTTARMRDRVGRPIFQLRARPCRPHLLQVGHILLSAVWRVPDVPGFRSSSLLGRRVGVRSILHE
jgi:hypothetical protein